MQAPWTRCFVFPHPIGLVLLVVVSQNMLYFKLENIRNDQDLMVVMGKIKHSLVSIQDPSDKILVVKIQDVASTDSTMIHKLEYKKTD